MKTLGLIGGLSWFSTTVYYRNINQMISQQLGGSHSARLLLYSVDFNDFRVMQDAGDWAKLGIMMSDIAKSLETAGADCILMCTNTPHLIADTVRGNINIPLLHIAEETAKEIVAQKCGTVGLIGTRFTMENSFFRDKLSTFGINVVTPEAEDRDFVHSSIFNELTKGIFRDDTKAKCLEIIQKLKKAGAQGVVFGCTEISLLIRPEDCDIPVFDTTIIHSTAAVKFALG